MRTAEGEKEGHIMFYGWETDIGWGWIFPFLCFGLMVLCMVGMIGAFLRRSRMGFAGCCGFHRLSLLFILSAAELLGFSTDVSWSARCTGVRLALARPVGR